MMTEPVVDFREIELGIVQVTMQDRIHKNTFSDELTLGLIRAFEKIRANTSYKAAILTGYDSYFAAGGTREGLLALHEGRARFSEPNIYSLALDCEIPVISAMQGHGIGGGFVMGLFADLVVLSQESVYTANFMKFGFTPGMGATFILPEKLGSGLAHEMLLLARNYRGEELKQRGIPFPVVPRAEVLRLAIQMARQLAEKPRLSLVTLKAHLVATYREKLSKFIEQELAMHAKTFHQGEVKAKINALFGR